MYRHIRYRTRSSSRSTFSRKRVYIRSVQSATRNQMRSRMLTGSNTIHRRGVRANPRYPTLSTRNSSAWNSFIKKYNKVISKANKKRRTHNRKLKRYQSKRYSFLVKRFYAKKPKLSSFHMQHFRMICASRILGPCVMINQILAPRTFDRVLMIPVDPDDFEIDMVATSNILSGKSMAERKEFMNMTEEVQAPDGRMIRKLKPRRRSENYSSFNDFFATVSTLTASGNK